MKTTERNIQPISNLAEPGPRRFPASSDSRAPGSPPEQDDRWLIRMVLFLIAATIAVVAVLGMCLALFAAAHIGPPVGD